MENQQLGPSYSCVFGFFQCVLWSCGFGPGFEGDVIAEAFEAALEIGNSAAFTDLVEIGFSEIAIDHAPGEHVISGHDNLMSNGQGGTQSAAPGLEAVELVPQIAPLVRAAEMAAPTRIVRRCTLPLRARPLFCLPALSYLPGQTPAQAARWWTLRKTLMSVPI